MDVDMNGIPDECAPEAFIRGDCSADGAFNLADAITLHTIQTFSGDYTVVFDAWMNALGPFPGGGSGSTEFLTYGVGGDGTTNNFPSGSGVGA